MPVASAPPSVISVYPYLGALELILSFVSRIRSLSQFWWEVESYGPYMTLMRIDLYQIKHTVTFRLSVVIDHR